MDDIEKVKQKIGVEDLIGQFLTLKKTGRNFKGICPFHSEKTPSFVIFENTNTFYCFGACKAHGDSIDFYIKINNVGFKEAVNKLLNYDDISTICIPSFYDEIHATNNHWDVLESHFMNTDLSVYSKEAFILIHDIYNN